MYEKLGMSVSPEETVEQEKVRVVMVPVGESRLELLEATSEDSTIAKFIAKRGEGLHHVCMRVPDLPQAVSNLKQRRRAAGLRRNQNRRGRTSLRVRASRQHRRRPAGVSGGQALIHVAAGRRYLRKERQHRSGPGQSRRHLRGARSSTPAGRHILRAVDSAADRPFCKLTN